jgi:probable F420-dependent oxidoreductase
MKLGLGLPHLGHLADPHAIRTVAATAEAAGLHSLWAMDRLLSPVAPRTLGYPGRSDGALPTAQQTVLDPLVALTVAATVTERIAIGTDVLVAPWYPPVLLARSLAAIDQVSGGRLQVGLGLGWSVDEFEAVGEPMGGRGRRLEEILDVLAAVWADDTIEITTSRERIAPSVMGAKPHRRPPILLGAHSDAGLDRIACRADGWLPFGIPLDDLSARWTNLLSTAERCGRDPGELHLVVRADPVIGHEQAERDRRPFAGSLGQVIGDVDHVRDAGATEVIFDFHATARSSDELVDSVLASPRRRRPWPCEPRSPRQPSLAFANHRSPYTLGGMCSRAQCPTCNRPTYQGCGRHVEQVLGDVPPSERCLCAEDRRRAEAARPKRSWFRSRSDATR